MTSSVGQEINQETSEILANRPGEQLSFDCEGIFFVFSLVFIDLLSHIVL